MEMPLPVSDALTRLLVALLLVAASASAPRADGEDSDLGDARRTEAGRLVDEAHEAMRRDDRMAAARLYSEARHLDPVLATCRHELDALGVVGLPLLAYDLSVRPDLHVPTTPPPSLDAIDAALSVTPYDPDLLRQRALILAMVGAGRQAHRDLSSAIAADPDDVTLHALRALLVGSHASGAPLFADEDEVRRALVELEDALTRGADHWIVLTVYGIALQSAAETERACTHLRAALATVPEHFEDVRLATETAALRHAVAACGVADESFERLLADAYAHDEELSEQRRELCAADH